MTTNIKFPTDSAPEWVEFEKIIRDVFENAGASQEMTEQVSARMKGTYERYNRKFNFALALPLPENLSSKQKKEIDNSIRKAVEDFTDEIHEYTSQVLLDRLCIEIELYKLRSIPFTLLPRDRG